IYVQDVEAVATYDALVTAQVDNRGWDAQAVWRMLSEGGRAALIAATGDHFASIASWRRACRAHPWRSARSFSVLEPVPRLVAELIAYGCREGSLHVNADWVLLEAVDRDYAPVRAGEASHTVLLTNLANRAQPLLRYDLGDSIVVQPEPCRCGNPLPAIQVQGRCDD